MKSAQLTNRSLLKLTGADTQDFLQNLVSNDLEDLSSNKVIYSALLTPQGKFLHDFFVVKWNDAVILDCLSDRMPDLLRRLTMYKLRANVSIEDISAEYSVFALFDGVSDKLPQSNGEAKTTETSVTYRDPRLFGLGARSICASNQTPPIKAETASLDEYVHWRMALGVPEGGIDILPEKNFLLEVNFEELNGVSFSKGCYVGQELTARTKFRAKIKKKLFAFTFDGEINPGSSITLNGKEIATVTSFAKPHGLALTRLAEWKELGIASTDLEPSGIQLFKPEYVTLPETVD